MPAIGEAKHGRANDERGHVLALLITLAAVEPALPPAQPAVLDRPARTLRLTAAQMFALAERARTHGDLTAAETLLTALARDPDPKIRAEARFRHARQLIAQGRKAPAAVLLRRLLDDQPGAAPVRVQLAQLMAELGDSDGALRELRSAQAGGLPPQVAVAVDRFARAIRARRPMGFGFEVALAPDSNINRATTSDTLGTVIGDFDIGADSKAKSGTGLALRGQAYRRFEAPLEQATFVARASASSDLYRRSDFNDIALDVAAGPELQLGSNRIALEAGLTRRWFGQEPALHSMRLGANWARPLGRRTFARLSGSLARHDNRLNDLQDGTAYSGRIDLERALTEASGIAAHVAFDRHRAREPAYSTSGRRAGLLGWHMLGQATVTAALNFGRLEADERLILFPRKRSDRYRGVTLGATLRRFEVGGMAPMLRLSFERNRSTLEFHDYRRRRTEIGLVRAF